MNRLKSNRQEQTSVSACRWITAVLGAVLLCAAAALYAAVVDRRAHPADSDCGACHLVGTGVDQAHPPTLLASQERLCSRCHPRAVEVSHPSGFAPTRALPAEYPLDWKGDLTCSTCHLAHGREPGMLRGNKRAKEFCQACHDQTFFARMKDAGTSLMLSGHLDMGHGTVDIDPHSMYCLGCHSGTHSSGGAVSVGRNGILRHASGFSPHPIGRSYREASRKGSFRPEHQLAQRNIKLSDGKISCVSCHEAYKQDHGRLVATLDRSALCLSCHAR